MMEMDRHMREELDRHITGNYGEDQFKDIEEGFTITFSEEERDTLLLLLTRQMQDAAKDLLGAREVGANDLAAAHLDNILTHRALYDKLKG